MMLVEEGRMSRSIMQRNYSHCPLKKRPVTILKEERPLTVSPEDILVKVKRPLTPSTPTTACNDMDDNSEPENLSTKPEDLSKTGNYPKKARSPVSFNAPLPKRWDLYATPPPVVCQLDVTAATAMRYPTKEEFQPLNLNMGTDPLTVPWHKPCPQYPAGYVPLNYHYPDVYRYPNPLYISEQLSPYAPRDSSSSSPSQSHSPPARSPLPLSHHDYRYLPYSPDASSLSPASSHGSSYPCISPPLAAAEDLTSPGSVSSDSGISGTSSISKKKKESSAPRYHCPDCSKSYSTYSGLSKHQQFHCAAAEGSLAKKSFSCKYCSKVYTSLGALKMHIRTHTLPCKCHLCGKAFSRPWLLQGHIRTHTGEKPFSCHHCRRAFADRSNLRAHLQTHSDVKKYSCSSCSKTFSRMSLLTKHMEGGCGCPTAANILPHYEYSTEELAVY